MAACNSALNWISINWRQAIPTGPAASVFLSETEGAPMSLQDIQARIAAAEAQAGPRPRLRPPYRRVESAAR